MKEISIQDDQKILIIAPHPDDECIGAGGLMCFFSKQCEVWVLSDGRYGTESDDPLSVSLVRKKEFIEEMKYLGIGSYRFFDKEDGKLRNEVDMLIGEPVNAYDIIFVPHKEEVHPDHKAAYKILANYINKNKNLDFQVYQYEITNPMRGATHYLNITSYISKKLSAIEKHSSQIELYDYAEAAKSLNSFRACMNQMKKSYIEVFKRTDLQDFLEKS